MTREYIEMCRKAMEIQKINPGCNGVITFLKEDLFIDESGELFYRHTTYPEGVESRTTSYFWLPRQEDLQAIYKGEQDCNFEFMLLRFREYVDKGIWDYGTGDGQWVCFNNQWHITDFTICWLCFVMETCYSKCWDTDKKEWVSL